MQIDSRPLRRLLATLLLSSLGCQNSPTNASGTDGDTDGPDTSSTSVDTDTPTTGDTDETDDPHDDSSGGDPGTADFDVRESV